MDADPGHIQEHEACCCFINFSSEISSFLSYEASACLLPKVLDQKLGPWNSSLEIVSVEDSARAWLGCLSFTHLWDLL